MTKSAVAPVVTDFASEVGQRLERLVAWRPTADWTQRSA